MSATLKNFSESANSRNAKTTLKLVIQSPDFGALLSHCGNKANSENGKANATAKPNIPTAGANRLFPAASTSKVPMIGPVQEKETITSVKAMNNMLKNPPVERALLSSLVDQLSGSVISNKPKKESANSTKIIKNIIFTTALVLKSFRAEAPNSIVTNRPKPTYNMIMLSPYNAALRKPLSVRLRKNDTVIGIIGHTHGVKIAIKPPNNPSTNIHQIDLSLVNSHLCTLCSDN